MEYRDANGSVPMKNHNGYGPGSILIDSILNVNPNSTRNLCVIFELGMFEKKTDSDPNSYPK